jgi:hypothetical protein
MLKVDTGIELVLRLYAEFERTSEAADTKVVKALEVLGLVNYDESCGWRAAPELIRLAYQCPEFLRRNREAIEDAYGKREDGYKKLADRGKTQVDDD